MKIMISIIILLSSTCLLADLSKTNVIVRGGNRIEVVISDTMEANAAKYKVDGERLENALIANAKNIYACTIHSKKLDQNDRDILAAWVNLERIIIVESILDDNLMGIFRNYKKLRIANFDRVSLTIRGLEELQNCGRLEQLYFHNIHFGKAEYDEIFKLKQLNSLTIHNCDFKSEYAVGFARLEVLESVHLIGCDLSDSFCDILRNMKFLKYVVLEKTGVSESRANILQYELQKNHKDKVEVQWSN